MTFPHGSERPMTVSDGLMRRVSTRQFLPDPLPRELLREVLDVARWAPSGGNLQPWRVVVITGTEREAVIRLANRLELDTSAAVDDRPVYPPKLWEPYRSRRFKVGEDMYALLGIPRSDRQSRLARWARNYEFFDAPVGLFFITDERFGHAQWAHLGMFMLAVALAAYERGVSSCMQESWFVLRAVLKAHLKLASHEMVYCGMALGIADPTADVNHLRSERMAVEEFAEFLGFE